MTRGPLNKLFHRAVQCRDQFVVTRLNDHGHPNKVSMKKKEKGEEGPGGIDLYIPPKVGRWQNLDLAIALSEMSLFA